MQRKEFLKTCGLGCLAFMGAGVLLQGCAGTKYLEAEINGANMLVPETAFEHMKGEEKQYHKYVVVHNEKLQYPVCVYRITPEEYHAVLMKCTHQGAELNAYGDRLQCPAHGSEFSYNGAVKSGPADTPLRTFPVKKENGVLKINLS